MSSLLPTIQAKSDQLNAEDLIGAPRRITITEVRVNTTEDQPVWISFKGDDGKPFKPCKTMRKLLVQIWGDDSRAYKGRALTLYNDPEVKWGGMKVGGIRISHASHLEGPRSFFLTETRGKKKQHTVQPDDSADPTLPPEPTGEELRDGLGDLDAAQSIQDLQAAWGKHPHLRHIDAFVARKNERKRSLENKSDF